MLDINIILAQCVCVKTLHGEPPHHARIGNRPIAARIAQLLCRYSAFPISPFVYLFVCLLLLMFLPYLGLITIRPIYAQIKNINKIKKCKME